MRAATAVNSTALWVHQGRWYDNLFGDSKKGNWCFGFWLEQEDNLPLACGAFTAKAKLWFPLLLFSKKFSQILCCFLFYFFWELPCKPPTNF